ncbi:MAG TPA: hypothetical protein DCM87_04600 [Planctomycetes bacterium]|nr:hypothetical protein [Planctomycetota bacterium]
MRTPRTHSCAVVFAAMAGAMLCAGPDDLYITEFLAFNESTYPPVEYSFTDEDKDCADWIEILNAGDDPVDLAGWFLSDDPGNLRAWEFPAMTIEAGQVLVIFASGKDRRDPAANLHTNFKLSSGGEYIALATPEGRVVAGFGPVFPRQYTNVSYGLAMTSDSMQLVPINGPVRVLVPADNGLGAAWLDPDFDDGAWTAGTGGVGFDRKTTPTYRTLIGTDIEASLYNVNTSAYIRMPFDVADVSRCDAAILSMHYDDGFVAYLNGVEIARRNAPAALPWNAIATVTHDGAKAEEIIVSGVKKLLRAGANVLAIHGLNRSPVNQNDFVIAASLTAVSLGSIDADRAVYFDVPTPGFFNGGGVPDVVDEPRPSHPSGCYPAEITVSFAVDAPDAVIYYTTNRTVPTGESTVYAGPIRVTGTSMIRARAFAPGRLPSPVVSYTYSVLLDATTANFTSDLPLMVVSTFGGAINETTYVPCQLFLAENPRGRTALAEFAPFASRAGLKLRGSSSIGFPKKMYALELWNERDKELDAPLLGFAEESDWILYPAYNDKTLMRDVLAYRWSNDIGRWAPRTRYMEMFLNTSTTGGLRYSTHYLGLYVLIEKIKRGGDRVDIERLYASQKTEPGITGGYILKNDRLDPGDAGFVTSGGGYSVRLCYVYPHENQNATRPPQEVATAEQKAWITNYLNRFQTALHGANFKDPSAGYAAYIDPLSFIDHHIIVELTKNIDGYRLSTFMYKDKGGKLNMGPVWDYNLCLGNANYNDGWLTTGWYYTIYLNSYQEYPFYRRLMQDPAFMELYRQRWFELRGGPLSQAALTASVDAQCDIVREAQARNFKRWPVLGLYVWPNWYIGPTWDAEVDWMRAWIRDRVLWMDSQFLVPPVLSSNGGNVDPGFVLTITAPAGAIMYTLNGPDPSSPEIQSSPLLLTYSEPITITQNTRVRARVQVGGSWSTMKEATFIIATPRLVLTEIMYNPKPASPYSSSQLEFLELANAGDVPIALPGVRFSKGVTFEFPATGPAQLDPGERVVVARDLNAFAAVYGTDGITVVAPWTGLLSDVGEAVQVLGPLGEPCVEVYYRDSWVPSTDGGGYSLVFIAPLDTPLERWGEQANWGQSAAEGGSPGRAEPAGGRQLPADTNQDGRVNISDAVTLIKTLYGTANETLPCTGATLADGGNAVLFDVNGDAAVNLADVLHLFAYLFTNGPSPAYGTQCAPVTGCPDVCTP